MMYGLLARMVCENKSRYIRNIETYIDGEKRWKTVLPILQNNTGLKCYIYQENFYNSVQLCENLMHRKINFWYHED
jgi:hypothetical protein